MKSYTDITQSKKLAEILPVESADMYYYTVNGDWEWYETPNVIERRDDLEEHAMPAWSLATLLDYLAKKDCFPEITYTGTCYLMDVNFYDDEEGKLLHPIHFIRTEGKSLVDACVEMILKYGNLIIN